MAKKLQELLSERSMESRNRIQQLAKELILDLPAHTIHEDSESGSNQNEVNGTNSKKPS